MLAIVCSRRCQRLFVSTHPTLISLDSNLQNSLLKGIKSISTCVLTIFTRDLRWNETLLQMSLEPWAGPLFTFVALCCLLMCTIRCKWKPARAFGVGGD